MRASEWVKQNEQRYITKAIALGQLTAKMAWRDVLAFVLFTPQLRYERSVIGWKHYMRTGEVLKDNMWKTRQTWISMMPTSEELKAMVRHDDFFTSMNVLVEEVAGLGYAKAPFFLSLLSPVDWRVPVCTDVHIMRAVGLGNAHPNRYNLGRAQERMQRRARRAGLPPFVYQWALWDFVRSKGKTETYLEHDLAL